MIVMSAADEGVVGLLAAGLPVLLVETVPTVTVAGRAMVNPSARQVLTTASEHAPQVVRHRADSEPRASACRWSASGRRRAADHAIRRLSPDGKASGMPDDKGQNVADDGDIAEFRAGSPNGGVTRSRLSQRCARQRAPGLGVGDVCKGAGPGRPRR
ncbi:hypothetical protein ADL12_20105 [Streptomyces regalis]|uniref:Uncharacterized protein n=2 Tax=Streptomyces regalis TaxID=68262 RepID=A0A0X3UTK0_9ACTN|nr:hypothetical protein ADL12_20105 [Streptomyces regalis]